METARTIVNESFQYANITNEATDKQFKLGLDGLNTVLNLLNVDGFFSFNIKRILHSANSDIVTIGLGGDIDIDRPLDIDAVYVSLGSQWQRLNKVSPMNMLDHKSGSGCASVYSYTGFPLGELEFDSAPNAQIALQIRPAFPTFDLNDEVPLPIEYKTAIRWALAVHLGRFYATENLPVLIATRDEVLDKIRKAGAKRMPNTYSPKQNRVTILNMGA